MTDIQGFMACDHEGTPLDDDAIRRMHSTLSKREQLGMGEIAEAIFSLLCLFRWRDIYDPKSCCIDCRWKRELSWTILEFTRMKNGVETVESRQTMLGTTCRLEDGSFSVLERCGRHDPTTG